METRLVPKEGYPIRTVTITNFHRSLAPADIVHNLGTLVNMQRSKKQARAILDEFQPDLWVGHRRLCLLPRGERGRPIGASPPPSTSPTPSPD